MKQSLAMTHFRKSLILLILLVSIIGCKDEQNSKDETFQQQIEQYEAVKQKALKLHDQIMPKMSLLMELSGELQEKTTEENQTAYTQAKNDLNEAHEAMYAWMADYNSKFPFEEASPQTKEILDQKMPVLAQEVDEIVALQEQTAKAISQAQNLLKLH